MKKLLSSILLSVIAIVVYSQAPASFRYQALIQDAAGNIKVNTSVTVLFDILQGGASGAVVYSETHSVTTTSTGLVNVDLGLGSATLGTFAAIDWSTGIYYLRITVNGTVMGTTQLLSVPYALYSSEAGNVFSGNYEDLTNQPDLTVGAMKKLTVTGETTDMEEALFEVKNKSGQTVFAVFNEGVRMYVGDGDAKGAKGGFAIGGFDDSKASSQDYFVVNPDSIRMYVEEGSAKGAKGGFAIGGFNSAKALPQNLLIVNSDSIRAFIDTSSGKGAKGGFAIGGFGQAKGTEEEYLRVTRDSTRVYINSSSSKASKGGFAIGGFGNAKGTESDYLFMNQDSTNFYVRSQAGNPISTFNILSVNENLLQKTLMSADADTILMTSVLNVQNDMSIIGDIGYTGTVAPITEPELSTSQVINVTQTSGLAGGVISSNGGGAIIVSGVCWSSTELPTVDLGNFTTDGSTSGSFTSSITGLTAATTYFVRAYATNSIGTGYGEEVILITNSISPVIASISTATPGSITATSAVSGGFISDNGGAQITVGGVCWSTSPGPVVTDNHTSEPYPQVDFISSMTGLTENTTYYVRAYATNAAGTAYGEEVSFTTPLAPITITDIDGNVYVTVIIGTQTWMAENLQTTRLNDGTAIPQVTDGQAWGFLNTPGYSWYENNEATYQSNGYGALYNWFAASSVNLCPTGWHVPDTTEMNTLNTFLGSSFVAGGKLKETGTSHWMDPNTGATNEFGFTALPGGQRNYMGSFFNVSYNAGFWTRTEDLSTNAYFTTLNYSSAESVRNVDYEQSGYSIRCVKD